MGRGNGRCFVSEVRRFGFCESAQCTRAVSASVSDTQGVTITHLISKIVLK